MSDLFEDDAEEIIEPVEQFEELEADAELAEGATIDARRRLEKMLEEKRLREELDDFVDY